MVIPDADVWIDFLNDRQGSDDLQRLVDLGQAAVVGCVLSEILRGAREDAERDRIVRYFDRLDYLEMTRSTWISAGNIAGALDARGDRIPMPDVFVAAIALEGGHEILTRDRHFERIPELRLYKPKGASDA